MAPPGRTGVFLLPFDAEKYTTYSFANPTPSPDPQTMPACFETLHVRTNAPPSEEQSSRESQVVYTIEVNDFVLLRPPTNAHAPSVGRVQAMFSSSPRGKDRRVRVQWFYKAQDYLEKLPVPPGEDEVLETPHFNDIEVETIVGKCTVSPLHEYHRLIENESFNNIGAAIEVQGKSGEQDNEGGQGGDEENCCDDEDDDGSIFGDNYVSSSTRYYCRQFYNACVNSSAVAKFEDSDVDPMQDYIDDKDDSEEGDFSSSEQYDGEESEDSDIPDGDLELEQEELSGSSRRKRRRGSEKAEPGAKRRRPRMRGGQAAVQFCLPDIDIEDTLPCRDEEKEKVTSFLRSAIVQSAKGGQGSGRCLYISGVPGTGKTATVREVLGKLRRLLVDGRIPPFEVVDVNGMTLLDVNAIYSELYAAVVGQRGVSSSRAHQLLRERFESKDERQARGNGRPGVSEHALAQGKCVVLLLDEMDVLVNRNRELLHTLLEWSARPNSRLAIIGIANTMDLPERLLARSRSRMGNDRLVYSPYKKDQLLTILALRLRSYKLKFQETAKTLVASKIASLSGDVRRALELCKRATTIAETDGCDSVSIHHVNRAIADMTGGARLQAVTGRPLNDRLVLIATLALSRSHGAFDVESTCSLGAILDRACDIALKHKSQFPWGEPHTEELERAVSNLSSMRIVIVERDTRPYQSRVVVNLSPDDIIFALRDDPIAVSELSQRS